MILIKPINVSQASSSDAATLAIPAAKAKTGKCNIYVEPVGAITGWVDIYVQPANGALWSFLKRIPVTGMVEVDQTPAPFVPGAIRAVPITVTGTFNFFAEVY